MCLLPYCYLKRELLIFNFGRKWVNKGKEWTMKLGNEEAAKLQVSSLRSLGELKNNVTIYTEPVEGSSKLGTLQ